MEITHNYLPQQYRKTAAPTINHNYLPQQFSDYPEIFQKIEKLVKNCEYTLGEVVDEFENNICQLTQAKHCIGVGSGTDALFLSLKALGIKEGDEVITTPYTFFATIGAIVTAGAKPVFVDINDDYNINPNLIEAAITSKTKAILPVHWSGIPCKMEQIMQIAQKHNLKVVEDACHAIDGLRSGKAPGTFGDTGCFSLHPLKNLNVWGDGGFIITNSKETHDKLVLLRNHGLLNRDECSLYGYNSRLDAIQAIVGNHLFKKIHHITDSRIRNAKFFDQALSKIPQITLPPRNSNDKTVYHIYVVRAEMRDELQKFLQNNDVDAKVHYPIPMHLQKASASYGYKLGDFPNAEAVCNSVISLPVHEFITREQQEHVVNKIRTFYSNNKNEGNNNNNNNNSININSNLNANNNFNNNSQKNKITKVDFVNLGLQYKNLRSEILTKIDEISSQGQYVLSDEVKKFEENFASFCQTKYAIGVADGTDALILSLKALGIGQGDEVITAPNSFIATAGAICAVGAKPVFVDVSNDFNINTKLIESAITSKTKAIIPIHLTGRAAAMDEINEISIRYNLHVIEDAAQAIGAKYKGKRVGSLGTLGCFSLHPLKNLHVHGDGGIITTNSQELYEKILQLRNHGLKNRDECNFWGYNSRLDAMQAAIGNLKLNYIKEWNSRHRQIAHIYREGLKDIIHVPSDQIYEENVYHNFIIQTEKRDELKKFLEEQEIGTAIHYPIPIHLQKAAASLGYCVGSFPITEKQSQRILSLPIYPELTNEQANQVVVKIKEFFSKMLESSV